MNLNSSGALYSLCTCKVLEILTIIRILIKYILRNLFYIVPVFKKCLGFFSLQKFRQKYRKSESGDLHYLNSGKGLTICSVILQDVLLFHSLVAKFCFQIYQEFDGNASYISKE